jgi:DNA-binding NarL/FixJ family response regulator
VSQTAHRIVVADDHPLFRGALRQALSTMGGDLAFEEAGSLDEVHKLLLARQDVDLVVLDLGMPGVEGFSGLRRLRAQHQDVPVVVVSGTEDHGVMRRCIHFGASGFIPKSVAADTMREAIKTVLQGGVWAPPDLVIDGVDDRETTELIHRLASLTPQQERVLSMLRAGLLNKQIAFELNVSEATVKAHVSAILQKLGVESRTQAVIAAGKIDAAAQPTAAPN